MLKTHHLSHRHDRRLCLDHISVAFRPGQLCVIGGPNGSGKSTLIRLLSGELRPSSGRISLDGMDLRHWQPLRLARRRAVLSQQVPSQPAWPVHQVVALGRSPYADEDTAYGQQAIAAALDQVGLRDQHQAIYSRLSGGQRARVQFARSLCQLHEQSTDALCLLDEPTASLDPRWQHQTMQCLKDCAARGWTVICVLHDLNLASRYADRLLILHDGDVALDGAPEQVLDDPRIDRIYQLNFARLRHDGHRYLHAVA
ncbi:MAG: heme ABC transporter ATP-binding protein [Oceanococcus sp.]|nr:MAG: heme ABC transporter ATP-binding protein [Oceanococcus sp.]